MVQSTISLRELINLTYTNLEAQDRWSALPTLHERCIALGATRECNNDQVEEPSPRALAAIVLERAWRLQGINPLQRATAISTRMTDEIYVLEIPADANISADMQNALA